MNYEADKASEKPIACGIRAGLADTTTQADDTGATALIDSIIRDVCELDYYSPLDDPNLLMMQATELETILRERIGQAWHTITAGNVDTGATTAAETPAAGLVAALETARRDVAEDIAKLVATHDTTFLRGVYKGIMDAAEIAAPYEVRDRADRARLEARVKELETTLRQSRSIWQGVHEELEAERQALTDLRAELEQQLRNWKYIKQTSDKITPANAAHKRAAISYFAKSASDRLGKRLTSLLSTSPVGGVQQQPGGDGDPTAEPAEASI